MEALEYPIARLRIDEMFTPEFYLLNVRTVKTIAGRRNSKYLKELEDFQIFLS